jgi:hypothetical protein
MPVSSAVSVPPRPAHTGRLVPTRAGLAAAVVIGLLAAWARSAGAQASPQPAPAWEFRATSGALIPTGAERSVLKDAAMSAAQLSWVVSPPFAITATVGWARSRDLVSAGVPRLDVFTYDLGAEYRAPRWFADNAVTFSPFVGAGAGARSYNYRSLDVDATHNIAGYGTVGGELGIGRVGLRLEVRDYVAGFKPLAGGGSSSTRNDVVATVGLRFITGKSE